MRRRCGLFFVVGLLVPLALAAEAPRRERRW